MMYDLLNINGVRTEAEIVNLLLDYPEGLPLDYVTTKFSLYDNQARNIFSRLSYDYCILQRFRDGNEVYKLLLED
tara:strand:+ start:57 stop:281 length:225 start_codon:yes stop_codon:yes gene_type:complete